MMKTIFRFTFFLLLALFLGCKDDDSDLTEVSFSFDFDVAGTDLQFGQVYQIGGVATSFSFAKFYAHDIKFEGASETIGEDTYLLVGPDDNFEIAEIPKNTYESISFKIGVKPEDNDQSEDDFTSRPTDDPLSMQSPERMHWNWNSGYIFFKINGMSDTDGDDVPDSVMEFHVGTNNFLREINIPGSFDLAVDQSNLAISVDLASLFEGIDLRTEFSCHTADAPNLAVRFADNWQDAFSIR